MNEMSQKMALIEAYVRFAEGLPTELSAVKVYLGYETTDTPVLSPASMQTLFKDIRAHADLWKNVTKNARSQLRELSITAADVVKNGNGLIRGLRALGPVAQILNTVGETFLNTNDFKELTAALDTTTLAKINHLKPYIDLLHSTSLNSFGNTNATNKIIADFRTQASKLEANVAVKVNELKSGKGEMIGKEKTIGPVIDAFKEARDRIVSEFGEGSEAALAVEKQIKVTLDELTSREANLQQQQRLTYAVGRLFIHLQGLGYAMINTQSALTQLWLASANNCTQLNNITTDIGNIGSEETLLTFYITFKKVLLDWTDIQDDASALYKLF
ncbi:MAG: frataxin-like iron-binding protein CyaY [Cognaticolwellia sp.]|jgi:frataxin-like iron-binding protein CyaY